jgi:hypothetical protein
MAFSVSEEGNVTPTKFYPSELGHQEGITARAARRAAIIVRHGGS